MTAIGIYGSLGRMGRAIADAATTMGARVAGGADASDDPMTLARTSDVLVDFSIPAALESHLAAACATATPMVIGTTGLTARHHALIDAAAQEIAILQTGNTSLGIALLARLTRDAAKVLGQDWDVEIVEMHHRHKVDAPSGTALMLGEAAAEGLEVTLSDSAVHSRAGLTGARSPGTIGFASLRGGSVAGDHAVIFAGNGERIELSHRAEGRSLFAHGAVRAALWLATQPSGRYTMDQVLGF